jgi:hypothetical protein
MQSPNVYAFDYISRIHGCFLGLISYPQVNDTAVLDDGVGGI